MIYYMGDLHLGHLNAMTKFDKRPFKTLDEQDDLIISNINKIVTPQDQLNVVGDFSWYNPQKTAELLDRINCKNRFLYKGNHDRFAKDGKCKKLFQGIYDFNQIEDNGRQVFICHFPVMMYPGQHRGVIHLYSHVHNTLEESDYQEFIQEMDRRIADRDGDRYKPVRAFNIGCMLWGYAPVTLDQILQSKKGI